MSQTELTFAVKTVRFDENYAPGENTRITTNFANLARGETRQANLRRALRMIDNRFNALAHWDNPRGNRYAVGLDIVSVDLVLHADGTHRPFPMVELLKTSILDNDSGARIDGVVGNNFSSYVRDYDFSILLKEINKNGDALVVPADFGDLHGKLFKHFLKSDVYGQAFGKAPVICLSASSTRTYHRTQNHHPVLGVEYRQDEHSLTDRYFAKMGMAVRYFMPRDAAAPLAFYCSGDLANDYTNLELIATISTMETFQKIYRPEIYNANSAAEETYRPSLAHEDFSLTQIVYDREERSRLATAQGKFAEEHFIKPYQSVLARWSASCAL